MSRALQALGVLVLVGGLGAAGVGGVLFATDAEYASVVAAYARHPDHAMFQVEYWMAALRHWGLLVLLVGGLGTGLVCGGLLLGMGQILARLPPR